MGRKRRLSIKWCIMLVIVGFVVMQTEAHGQSWKWNFFLGDSECNSFYDPETVFRSPENIVRVWWKEVFKTKQVLISRGFTGSEYEKAAYQINVIEINCKKKVYCRKFFMICSEEGENILCNIHRRQPDEWVSVREGHAIGALYWKLCQ
jgi:hypothetical protein